MPLQVEERQSARVDTRPRRRWRWIAIALGVIVVALIVLAIVTAVNWPFTRGAVIQSLQQQSGSKVDIANFQDIYFPHPGCIAQGVTFRRGGTSGPPLATIDKLSIMGSYHSLLFHHITIIRAERIHITIPAQGSSPPQSQMRGASLLPVQLGKLGAGVTIGKVIADGAEVEFLPDKPGKQPLVYRIPKLALHNLAQGQPLLYHATIFLPLPPAEVYVEGKFSQVKPGAAGQTIMSGTFDVEHMNLGVFGGIAGTLASKGSFDGVLQHIMVQGATNAPDFQVIKSGHPLHLVTHYKALVDGLNGDVVLEWVTAQFGRTTIIASGPIEGEGNAKGKTAALQLYSDHARVQDLLWLFVNDKKPAMSGPIIFRAKATLPPEERPFLDRVQLQGDFGISGAQYPHSETQKDVDVLSARARGKADEVEDENDKRGNDSFDPGRVLSNVKGHVLLKNGVAHLSNISFDVPGAAAHVDGTYNLKNEAIDLAGYMHLETQLSKATTGVKSFLLKVIQPLTSAKKHQGSIVSLKIGGTYKDPKYTVLPTTKKQDTAILEGKSGAKGH